MKKESFLIYKSFYAPIEQLSDEDLGKLFRAIFDYQIDGKDVDPSSSIFMAFQFFKNQFSLDEKKYIQRCEKNRDNIRKRWEEKNDPIQTNTNHTDKEKEKEKVKGKGKGKENVKGIDLINPFPPEFLEIWEGWKDYKKSEYRFNYKNVKSEQMGINNLFEISKGDPEEAKQIIKLAIVNGWKGLFARKNPGNKNPEMKEATKDHLQEIKERLS